MVAYSLSGPVSVIAGLDSVARRIKMFVGGADRELREGHPDDMVRMSLMSAVMAAVSCLLRAKNVHRLQENMVGMLRTGLHALYGAARRLLKYGSQYRQLVC
jgi:hypothetical protein